jgi:GNAT superfamily N-acetyltransferase
MIDARLENPVWHALSDVQSQFAQRFGAVLRFPSQIGPFMAVQSKAEVASTDLCAATEVGEVVDFVGVLPKLGADWQVGEREAIAQMHCAANLVVAPGPSIERLGPADAGAMLSLTALVYPGYFRERTHELGDYYGIRDAQNSLVAMAGERMRIGSWHEISAVCTHPQHRGRGHAQRLVATLVNAMLQRGERPFLHVSMQNTPAIRVYQQLGFNTRAEIGVWLAQRVKR